MARTALAAQIVDADGLGPNYTAANADGHTVNVGDIVHVKNADAAPITVTVQTGRTVRGRAVAEDSGAVPAGGERFFGGFEADLHGQPSGADQGKVYIDFSAVANVTVAALKQ